MLLIIAIALCDYCIESQLMCFSALLDQSGLNVTVTMKISNTIGWAAWGTGNTMDNSDMVIAWKSKTGVVISPRYSTAQQIPTLIKTTSLTNQQYNTKDAKNWFVTFTRPLSAIGGFKNAITKGKNTFMYASSEETIDSSDIGASFGKHDAKGTFEFDVATGSGSSNLLLLLHGWILCILWIVLTPISVIVARYFKHIGHKWFIFHSFSQFVTVSCTIVLGLLMESKYDWKFKTIHEIIGTVIIAIGALQVFSGFYIHFTYDPSRSAIPWRDIAHGIVGFLTWFLSIYQMISGLNVENKIRLYAFSAIGILMFFAMVGFQLRKTKK